jgi:hypothetical protein
MKKIIALTLMTLGSFLSAGGPMAPQVDPFELLNNMDPKELDKLMEDLAKMSPEEIKYYEDLGKQMFKDSGYDLDEIAKTFPAQVPAPATPQPVTNKPEAHKPSKQEKPAIDEPSKKEKDSLLRMVKALSESLASIRQKAASDETLHPHLAPLQQELDLLTAYVNRLDYERHLKHFADKEFAALKTKLRKMSSMLEEFDNNLFVPQLTLRKSADNKRTGSYGTQMHEATSVLKEFKTYMTRAFSSDAIITDIETLFKKHDQEALTLKKQIEEQQKKASEQVKKLSTTNTGKFAPIPKVTNQPIKTGGSGNNASSRSGSSYPSSGGNASGGYQPQRPGASQPQQSPKAAATAPKPGEKTKEQKEADAKTREKKDPDFAEVPLTPQEALERTQKNLRSVNVEVARNKQDLLRLADDIATKQTSTEPDREVLLKIVQLMKETNKTLEEYFKTLSKEKNQALETKNRKILKDAFETQYPELKEVNEKFTALDFASFPAPLTEEMDTAKGLVEGFKKYFTSIAKQFKPASRF